MDNAALSSALTSFKVEIERAITSSSYGSRVHSTGLEAKNAAIRSGTLISLLHEVVKLDFAAELHRRGTPGSIYPPIGSPQPELSITGFIKAKKQDVTVMLGGPPTAEVVAGGPLDGERDAVGYASSERSIVCGVRSQMSSVNKNFDTLMERAFAETLNLRLRIPALVMGEVYLIPAFEYDDEAMKANLVAWKSRPVNVTRFIKTFAAISGRRAHAGADEQYKYERTALVVADFGTAPVKVYARGDELQADGITDQRGAALFDSLTPTGFAGDLLDSFAARFR